MLRKKLHSLSVLGNKTALACIVLVASPLVWYSTVLIALMNVVGSVGAVTAIDSTSKILIWSLHFSGLILSALVGAKVARKFPRIKFLTVWMIIGIVMSLSLLAVSTSSIPLLCLLAILLGVSFGIGMPACMSYYSDYIAVENRGRVSGIAMLVSGIGIFVLGYLPTESSLVLGLGLAGWRLGSLLIFLYLKSPIVVESKKGIVSYKSIVSQRSFLTYYVPWIMFSFVNYLTAPIETSFAGDSTEIGILIKTVFLAIFAVLGGFFFDSIGRKRVAIAGFTVLGLSAAALGLSPSGIFGLYFSAALEGTAWGFLLVLFLLTLWGDLSQAMPSDKFYAIGVAPYFFSKFLELTIGGYIASNVQSYALFPFVSFFLFLAVLPLVYAPETLPEKVMKDRELKSYLETEQKIVQKETEKNQKQEASMAEKENEESKEEPKESPEDEEARKLAEKYY
jgi:MFS family permease